MLDRRDFLIQALAAGVLSTTVSPEALAQFWGKRPRPMAKNKSFHELKGDVLINGNNATTRSLVKPGDKLITGDNSSAIFVVGKDAFSIGENSELELDGELIENTNPVVRAFSLLSGKLLTVFGKTGHKVTTSQTTIGIRGTGVYLEAEANRTYMCTCYGVVDVSANADPSQTTTVTSRHHDQPLYIYGDNSHRSDKLITTAPMKNHTDMELALLEALVGRTVPFAGMSDYYGAPTRNNY